MYSRGIFVVGTVSLLWLIYLLESIISWNVGSVKLWFLLIQVCTEILFYKFIQEVESFLKYYCSKQILSLQKYLIILSFLTLNMENVVTVEIDLPSWFGSDMVKGFFKTNFTQLLYYSFYHMLFGIHSMDNNFTWNTFKG